MPESFWRRVARRLTGRSRAALAPGDAAASLDLAKLYVEQGRIDEAEALLLQGLALAPGDANYLFGLGNARRIRGDIAGAESRYRQALLAQPKHAPALLALAQLRLSAGQGEEAEQLLRDAFTAYPGQGPVREALFRLLAAHKRWDEIERLASAEEVSEDADALHWLALAVQARGDNEGAERLWRRANAIDPAHPRVASKLGRLLATQRAWAEAVPLLKIAHAAQPKDRTDLFMLAASMRMLDDYPSAISAYEALLDLDPHHAEGLVDLGLCYYMVGRPHEAGQRFEQAILEKGRDAELLRKLAMAYVETGRDSEAETVAREALEIDPELLEAYSSLGLALAHLGRVDEAQACFDRVIASRPDDPDARWYRARLLLGRGEFEAGWQDFEWRWRRKRVGRKYDGPFPPWEGQPLEGKRLLVYGEQGLGDEIMFASCLPQLPPSTRYTVLCEPRLASMFRRSFAAEHIAPASSWPEYAAGAHGSYDFQCPAGDLPRFLRLSLGSFPMHSGYLRADEVRTAAWRRQLSRLGSGLKVGLSWRGGTGLTRGDVRSLDLERCAQWLQMEGVHLISLQYTSCEEEIAELYERHGTAVHHWPEAIADYEETAALVCAVDLVVSVCTSLVHLTGALGREVWVMTPFSAEWRYMFQGERMPWYPSARIYRQPAPGDWESVLGELKSELVARLQT